MKSGRRRTNSRNARRSMGEKRATRHNGLLKLDNKTKNEESPDTMEMEHEPKKETTKVEACSIPSDVPSDKIFQIFDDAHEIINTYDTIKQRFEELNVELWTLDRIRSVYKNENFKDRLVKQVSTVCHRNYLQSYPEPSYVSTNYLLGIFNAAVIEHDPNTDMILIVKHGSLEEIEQAQRDEKPKEKSKEKHKEKEKEAVVTEKIVKEEKVTKPSPASKETKPSPSSKEKNKPYSLRTSLKLLQKEPTSARERQGREPRHRLRIVHSKDWKKEEEEAEEEEEEEYEVEDEEDDEEIEDDVEDEAAAEEVKTPKREVNTRSAKKRKASAKDDRKEEEIKRPNLRSASAKLTHANGKLQNGKPNGASNGKVLNGNSKLKLTTTETNSSITSSSSSTTLTTATSAASSPTKRGRATKNSKNSSNNNNKQLPTWETGEFVVQGILIASYGYNLCACLPIELKETYVTLDILCSRQHSKGIGTLLMVLMVICTYTSNFRLIGLQVAGSMDENYRGKKTPQSCKGCFTNLEGCWFYESFGFKYDNRPRDSWICFDPEDADQTTMLLDMNQMSLNEVVETCTKKLTKDGAKIPTGHLPPVPEAKKPLGKRARSAIWQDRRKKRRRYSSSGKPRHYSSPPPSPPPSSPSSGYVPRKERRTEYEAAMRAVKEVLGDNIARTVGQLYKTITTAPYYVHFGGETPQNTLSSILTKDLQGNHPTVFRIPNTKPYQYTLR